MTQPSRRLLVTDLDNTIWDWFEAWYQSFSALLEGLVEISGVDQAVLEDQIRAVHQRRGTTEYSNLVREVPALIAAAGQHDPVEVFDDALHAQNARRKATTRLYPGVDAALRALQGSGVRIAAYTESGAYWTEWRIRQTGLDGVIDVLYSSPDHDQVAGVDVTGLRTGHYPPDSYGLHVTKHHHVPHGVLKPNQEILRVILREEGCAPDEAVYLGDSLMKDIAMAQAAGVLDVHAAYGLAQHRDEYELLRRVTHWSAEDVAQEKELANSTEAVVPTHVCRESLNEILLLFGLSMVGDQ